MTILNFGQNGGSWRIRNDLARSADVFRNSFAFVACRCYVDCVCSDCVLRGRELKIGDSNYADIIRSAFRNNDDKVTEAAHNVELVRDFMQSHLGCTAKEVAFALGLSGDQARRAVRKIRKEWSKV